MMNQETILAEIYELVRNEYIDRVTLYQQIASVLATMPSNEEISLRMWEEWQDYREYDEGGKLVWLKFPEWLDKEAE